MLSIRLRKLRSLQAVIICFETFLNDSIVLFLYWTAELTDWIIPLTLTLLPFTDFGKKSTLPLLPVFATQPDRVPPLLPDKATCQRQRLVQLERIHGQELC